MPIVDVEVVCQSEAEFNQFSAAALANALGVVFGSPPGATWVKLRFLGGSRYAENQVSLEGTDLPAFVSVLHAHVPQGEALAAEAKAITNAVALCLGRARDRVHVRYEPSAVGRQVFGGNVVR
jgi:phenylpyruvate tautomerase PptA (4-oxalocrotonate tautomerase family)